MTRLVATLAAAIHLAATGVAAQPFARALARRALEIAGEVATGRLAAADVTRKPIVAPSS